MVATELELGAPDSCSLLCETPALRLTLSPKPWFVSPEFLKFLSKTLTLSVLTYVS